MGFVWVLVFYDGGLWWVHGGAEYFGKFGFEWWFMGVGLPDFEVFVSWMMDLNCGKLRLLWVFWWFDFVGSCLERSLL